MKEVFKDIPDYKYLYQVSDNGSVKSLERYVVSDKVTLFIRERILKPYLDKHGYLNVSITKDSVPIKIRVHQLVAIAFLNHVTCGHGLVVNHIDFNKLNNNASNLEIVTQRENANQKHLKSSSKLTGVSWSKKSKKWCSSIHFEGKTHHLGYFVDELEASKRYQRALKNIR